MSFGVIINEDNNKNIKENGSFPLFFFTKNTRRFDKTPEQFIQLWYDKLFSLKTTVIQCNGHSAAKGGGRKEYSGKVIKNMYLHAILKTTFDEKPPVYIRARESSLYLSALT